MSETPGLTRTDFERLLAEQQRLVELGNELEYRLYLLGQGPPDAPVTACQQAGGALLGALRDFLFRQDQEVLPVLDELTRAGEHPRGRD
jgi:hypothetical protein